MHVCYNQTLSLVKKVLQKARKELSHKAHKKEDQKHMEKGILIQYHTIKKKYKSIETVSVI